MKMKTSQIVSILVITGLGAGATTLAAYQLSHNKKEAESKIYRNDPNQKVSVKIGLAATKELSDNLQMLGTLEPNREVKVASDASGKVVSMNVKEGDYLGAGTVIAQLDNELLQLQLELAKANYEQNKADVSHYEALVQGNAIPATQLDKATLLLKSTEIQIRTLEKQIKNTTLVSPFSGVVTLKLIDLGSVVGPGTPLIQLTDIGTVKLTINVPERDIMKFRVGQAIASYIDLFPNVVFPGVVSLIGSKGDNAHNYPVQIMIQNSGQYPLKAGMYGSIKTDGGVKKQALTIPRSALIGTIKSPQVFVVQNEKAILKDITIGISNGDYVEVLSGIQEGDTVVVSGQINLEDNSLIIVQ